MSIEVVKKFYAATFSGDMSTARSMVSADCQWDHRGPEGPPVNQLFVGPDGIEEFFRILGETQETLEFDVKEWFGDGDRVVALGSIRLRVIDTGKEWGSDFAFSHTVQDGRITKWNTVFDMTAEAEAHRP